jgi:hypothetical protein
MKASMPNAPELRDEPRLPMEIRARFEAPLAAIPQEGEVTIKEVSSCGVRVLSEKQLHPDEALLLRVPGHVLPLHADVVWVEEREPARWGGHKTWLAGCRFRPESIAQARLALPPLQWSRKSPFRTRALWMAAGVVGVLALLVYLYLRFAQWMGGG